MRRVEQMLIDVCAELGVATTRVQGDGRSGVWVPADDRGPDRKVAAIGIRVARGVTLHGFALNCNPDLTAYDKIVPCGIRDAGVTSLSARARPRCHGARGAADRASATSAPCSEHRHRLHPERRTSR